MRAPRLLIFTVFILFLAVGLPIGFLGGEDAKAQPRQNRNPPSACEIVAAESSNPADTVRVCDQASITVTAAISSPASLPVHVVFVIAKHLLMFDHLDDTKKAAARMLNSVDFAAGSRAGVVSLSVQARREQDLTDKKGSALSAINGIKLDNVSPDNRYYDWMSIAEELLEEGRDEATSPLEVIVLMSTGCPLTFEDFCTRQRTSASRVESKGVHIIGVCNPDAVVPPPALPNDHCDNIKDLATRGSYYDLKRSSRADREITEFQNIAPEASLVRFREFLTPNFSYVPGSGNPSPKVSGNQLIWEWEDVGPTANLTATYKVQPAQEGSDLPLRLPESQWELEDSLERDMVPVTVSLRSLNVAPCIVETPTPVPTDTPLPSPTPMATATATNTPLPTATDTATASPSPTPTSEPKPVYLPLLFRGLCTDLKQQQSDILILLDASSSMQELSAGTPKIEAAKNAAQTFIEFIDLNRDRVAILSFAESARVHMGLSSDREALRAALGSVETSSGTRVDRALSEASSILGSRGSEDRRPVLVLLTDGLTAEGSEEASLANASALLAGGAAIYAIGLGSELDTPFLERIVGGGGRLLLAPDASTLEDVYSQIAIDLPCPGGVPIEGP